jgi:hypothetical protein
VISYKKPCCLSVAFVVKGLGGVKVKGKEGSNFVFLDIQLQLVRASFFLTWDVGRRVGCRLVVFQLKRQSSLSGVVCGWTTETPTSFLLRDPTKP